MKMGETRSVAGGKPLRAMGERPPGEYRWSEATRPRSFLRRPFMLRKRGKISPEAPPSGMGGPAWVGWGLGLSKNAVGLSCPAASPALAGASTPVRKGRAFHPARLL